MRFECSHRIFIQIVKDRIKNSRLLTFAKNNIKKNAKERVLFNNYKERVATFATFMSNHSIARHGWMNVFEN